MMTTLTVGLGLTYKTLASAVAAAKPGDTIDVQAGTYTNDFPGLIRDLTIEGVGGIAKLVATAQPGNGKAILDVAGNTTLKNLDISGVTVPDANGAAIRYESGNLVIQNTAIHGNQDGILGAPDPAGTITITGSEIYDNGTSTGSTHNIYIGDIATFTLTNSYIHDANTGHEVKSRAQNNIITNNRIEDNGSTASYQIDLPYGGNATISGNTIQKSANSGNHVIIAYGEEGSPHAGTSVSITNNSFISDQSGAYAVWDTTGAPITASGNVTYNVNQIDKSGHLSANGFSATSTRPTLDRSSPINQSAGSAAPITRPPPVVTPPAPPTPTPTPAPNTPAPNTTAPSLTVMQAVSGTTTQTSNILSGTVSDRGGGVAAVEIFINSAGTSIDLGSATLNGGNWTYAISNLAPGTYNFFAVGFDKAGHTTATISTGAAQTVVAPAPTPAPTPISTRPAIASITSANNTFVIKGTAQANTKVVLTDTPAAAQPKAAGFTAAGSDGSWTISTQTLSTNTVNTLSASTTPGGGTAGAFIVASTAADTLRGTAGQSDVFAFPRVYGNDIIQGFETTAAVGSSHDVINLSGTSYTSFAQLKPLISGTAAAVIRFDSTTSITLPGVGTNSLQASDFRFS